MKPIRVLCTAVWLLLAVKLGKYVFYGAFLHAGSERQTNATRKLRVTGKGLSILIDVAGHVQVLFFCRRALQALLLNEITFGKYSKDAIVEKTLAVVWSI